MQYGDSFIAEPGHYFHSVDAVYFVMKLFNLWIRPCIFWKASEQYFLMVLVVFVIQCGSNALFFSLWVKSYSVTILWKATELYFDLITFVLCYSVVLTF